ncbi:polysaccharide deacetylase family sporulation protein PdaB [Halobacillus sp. A5]|uniref:polysaccharide deacetylase family sporulation protein PdaB n=1 Tax=Halobacillus sp. A5 TaxID=2880263 RepID=UPI0020A6A7D2|nr:polysaccharide deacetylase family sporulation protein PdaB [Halobacillus sp. A5]MCP3029607.1 polysaccharide deacetylase family sporulation protein PdaB [Halobacillus sp. A5]
MNFLRNRIDLIKRYGIIVVIALFCAVLMWVGQRSQIAVFSSDGEPRALSQGSEEHPFVSLTFNISWGNNKVHEILKKLETHDAKATFFLSGEWAERHPDIVKSIHEAEHEIAMMGYAYTSYPKLEPQEMSQDIEKAREVFNKLGFEEIKWFRPPHGHYNKEVLEAIDGKELEAIQWSVNPRDWENPGTNQIIDQILEETGKGDIVLLHASDSVKQTDKALEVVLPGLKQKDLEFATITELVNGSKAKITQVE